MKNMILLGATGSIGTQTLDIIRNNNDYRLVAFSFGNNVNKAMEIIDEFKPLVVCSLQARDAAAFRIKYPNIEFIYGEIGLQQIVTLDFENPIVVNALVGAAGLMPTMCAIENNRDVYLANKESLVIGGEIIMKKAIEKGVKIIPIDSEHSAIFQLLNGNEKQEIAKLIITASGGSLRDKTKEELENVTKEEALHHPNWKMGEKITIDSATMMNKGFELIEAHYLFDIDIDQIEPVIHKESIIHSMVEFKDGSIFAQMASSDMHLPIQYALEYPHHLENNQIQKLDLTEVGNLHFEKLSYERYPLVKLAIESLKKGKLQCTILNAANEAAVRLFLEEKIKFVDIEKIIINALNDPSFQGFNEGEVTVPKIMALHELVYQSIYYNY